MHPITKLVRALAVVLLLMTCWSVAPGAVQTQPPSPPEGFVPIDQLKPKEELPAAPLVMAAYGVAWVVVFGYVWSIWRRLGKVEEEIASVSRRVASGSRR